MAAPAQPQPAHYALTSVYTDYRLAGAEGPTLLTGDPFLAAEFFLRHDRAGHLEVLTDSAFDDGRLTPCQPAEILDRALRELAHDDPRRSLLDHAQAQWLEHRLYPPGDPAEWEDDEPSWERAGTAWGAAFGPRLPLPEAQVLDRLAEAATPGGEGRHSFSWSAFAVTRAIRQAGTPAPQADPALLRANAQLLDRAPHREPAVRAAAQWYLEQLAATGPLSARPPAPAPAPARGTAPGRDTGPDPDAAAAADDPVDARALLEDAAREALDRWGFDETTRTRLENTVARTRGSVEVQLPAQPASDVQAALLWRRMVPSAARDGRDCDEFLNSAFDYAAHARREAEAGTRSAGDTGSVRAAEELAYEVQGRHAILGRLYALARAENAADALEIPIHDAAQRSAEAAGRSEQEHGAQGWEAHAAGQAALLNTYDSARRVVDQTLEQQRRTVRATVAAHIPRPTHHLYEDLFRGVDARTLTQARTAYAAASNQLDHLTARAADPSEMHRPSNEDLAAARELAAKAQQRWEDLQGREWPAAQAAMRVLRAVMDLPAPRQPADDGLERLAAHRRTLTERLTENLNPAPPAPAPVAPARASAHPQARQQTARPAPSAPQRGVR